jgi:hypothetical protein
MIFHHPYLCPTDVSATGVPMSCIVQISENKAGYDGLSHFTSKDYRLGV